MNNQFYIFSFFLCENTLCQLFPTFGLHMLTRRLPTGSHFPQIIKAQNYVTFNCALPEGLALGRERQKKYSQICTFLFCLPQRCDLAQQLHNYFHLNLYSFLVLLPCITEMVSVTVSLSVVKRHKYLCLEGPGSKQQK